jgi:hypothetical protein
MTSANNLKQITQNILDTSYKLYSDTSLISSSLFKAATALGAELPEVPQISFIVTQKEVQKNAPKETGNAIETIPEVKKAPFFRLPKKDHEKAPEKHLVGSQNTVNLEQESKLRLAEQHEQKINKIAKELPKELSYKPVNLQSEERGLVAPTSKQSETKISLEEKEAKLNSLQRQGPVKVENKEKIETKFEGTSLERQYSSQSKPGLNTTNLGTTNGSNEEINEIVNNPLNRLLSIVKERHSITSTQAAQSLNVSKELIEKWARILNQSSLVRIRYQLMGDMILEA